MMEPLRDVDLFMPLLMKLTKEGRCEVWREACLVYPEEIWSALKNQGNVDLHSLKYAEKIPG